MAVELSIEANAKKIETLTKVARLLGDQIKEQKAKIENLQIEMVKIQEQLGKIADLKVPISSLTKMSIEPVTTPSTQFKSIQTPIQASESFEIKTEKQSDYIVEKTSDKEELLRALKIIDDL